MPSVFPKLRWLKCRLLRLISVRSLLFIIFCCAVLEFTRGFPARRQTEQDMILDNNAHLKAPEILPGGETIVHREITIKDDVKKKLLKLNPRGEMKKTFEQWWTAENQNQNPNHIPELQPLQPIESLQIQFPNQQLNVVNSPTGTPYNGPFYENRIIHFDLKGAAPKMSYLKEVLRLFKAAGATGILLEWEDTFPFEGILAENRNTDAYTKEEVRDFLKTAQSLNLDVIPLVQTFGHLEWILKVEKFRQYRQVDMYPQVICLADDDAVELVKEALRQVIRFHLPYGIRYFHVGADEAFQYGECMKDRAWLRQDRLYTKDNLAAMHLEKIARFVKGLIPGVRILAWYDMIKSFESTLIRQHRLDHLLEVVVWDYSETLQQQNEFTWRSLAERFPTVWGSSAYKGANTPSSQYLDLNHYFLNNKEWTKHRKMFGQLFRTFRGLIITGWQRYDHFAVLCELIPVALPSAILNLMVAKRGVVSTPDAEEVLSDASSAMNCTSTISLHYPTSLSTCEFPGSVLFHLINGILRDRIKTVEAEVFENYQVKGWLNRFNARHNYTQLWYLAQLQNTISMHFDAMLEMTKMLRSAMMPIFYNNTIDEWIYEYVDPTTERLVELLKQIDQLQKQRTFPVRNFKIRRQIIKQEL